MSSFYFVAEIAPICYDCAEPNHMVSIPPNVMNTFFASGPFLTPMVLLVLLVLILCLVLPMAFFFYAFLQFYRERLWPGLTCFLLSVMFLLPLWGMRSDGYHVLIAFAVVCVLAVPLWFFFVRAKQ